MLAAACGAASLLVGGAAAAQVSHYNVVVRRVAPAASDKGFAKINVSKAAVGAAPILLWQNTALDPDCTAHEPGPTLKVLTPPAHGEVRLSDEPFYPNYPANSPRAACNSKRVGGNQAFYTAQAGFTGKDKVVLQGAQPGGYVREIRVDIDVR